MNAATDGLAELRARLLAWLQAHPGWTARRLSLAAGLAENAVGRILAGVRPTPATCARLAAYLGWDVDEVLALAGHRPAPPAPRTDPWAKLETVLHHCGLDAEGRIAVLTLARGYVRGSQ